MPPLLRNFVVDALAHSCVLLLFLSFGKKTHASPLDTGRGISLTSNRGRKTYPEKEPRGSNATPWLLQPITFAHNLLFSAHLFFVHYSNPRMLHLVALSSSVSLPVCFSTLSLAVELFQSLSTVFDLSQILPVSFNLLQSLAISFKSLSSSLVLFQYLTIFVNVSQSQSSSFSFSQPLSTSLNLSTLSSPLNPSQPLSTSLNLS